MRRKTEQWIAALCVSTASMASWAQAAPAESEPYAATQPPAGWRSGCTADDLGAWVLVPIGAKWYQAMVGFPRGGAEVRVTLAGDPRVQQRTVALSAVRCGGGVHMEGAPPNEFILRGPGDPGGTPVTATTALSVGQRAQLFNESTADWSETVVSSLDPSGLVTVRPVGYPTRAADTVARARLRVGGTVHPFEPMPGERATPAMPNITGGRAVRASTSLTVGQAVFFRSNGTWTAGLVTALEADGRVWVRELGSRWNNSPYARPDLRIGGRLSVDR
jgi:hypothetical protein